MKKSIIAVMGLFTLVACSEDAYQETDKVNETRNEAVENSAPQNSIKTVGSYYNSPFNPYVNRHLNKTILTSFSNLTPLKLELEPFGENIHVQTFLIFNSSTYPPSIPLGFSFSAMKGKMFTVPPGNSYNSDFGAPVSVLNPPFSNPAGTIVYDFGNFSNNDKMFHYGKIHYFRYKVSNSTGVIATGFIKQRFFSDTDDHMSVKAQDSQWEYLTDVTGLPPMYDVVAMFNTSQDEICLTNKKGYVTPFPHQVSITDPATGIAYSLDFSFPSGASALRVRFQ